LPFISISWKGRVRLPRYVCSELPIFMAKEAPLNGRFLHTFQARNYVRVGDAQEFGAETDIRCWILEAGCWNTSDQLSVISKLADQRQCKAGTGFQSLNTPKSVISIRTPVLRRRGGYERNLGRRQAPKIPLTRLPDNQFPLSPGRLCRNYGRACFLSFRPKGEILNSGHFKNQDFSPRSLSGTRNDIATQPPAGGDRGEGETKRTKNIRHVFTPTPALRLRGGGKFKVVGQPQRGDFTWDLCRVS
jgi:hypothetical protein